MCPPLKKPPLPPAARRRPGAKAPRGLRASDVREALQLVRASDGAGRAPEARSPSREPGGSGKRRGKRGREKGGKRKKHKQHKHRHRHKHKHKRK